MQDDRPGGRRIRPKEGGNGAGRPAAGGAFVKFFTGLHQPSDAQHFDAAFVSVHRLRTRKSAFAVGDWIMDSGAFSTILSHGGYPHPVSEYAEQIRRWKGNGRLLAAVSQDWMCEPHMLKRTAFKDGAIKPDPAKLVRPMPDGVDVLVHEVADDELLEACPDLNSEQVRDRIALHQRLTIERYDALLEENTGVYIMPVLQGYAAAEYVAHLRAYGERLAPGAWVGVGSICKRNSNPWSIWKVLDRIKEERPDLQLHGFGLKTTSLEDRHIRELLATADSMAWSFAARREGRNPNDWREARAFGERIAERVAKSLSPQGNLLGATA